MGRYANNTKVAVEKTRLEIESVLTRYGADQFMTARDDAAGQAVVQFRAKERYIRFRIQLPKRYDKDITHSGRRKLSETTAQNVWEQACRSMWRSLLLCIKAKLEAVDSGICEFEDEFMANIVLPDQQTVAQWLRPQVRDAYLSGEMPQSLLALPAPK